MISEDKILEIARSWLGTKFHHQGRKKGVGVDCIGLIVGVASEVGLKLPDRLDYARQPDGNELREAMDRSLVRVKLAPATIALFNIEGHSQHVGIISDHAGLGVIHAYSQARKVVEHGLDDEWHKRIIATYALA